MEAIEALIVSRSINQKVFMLCLLLFLYLGCRLLVHALDHNGQARAELRDKDKSQAAGFLPGVAYSVLAVVIGFAVFSHPLELSKAEQDLLMKVDQIDHPHPAERGSRAAAGRARIGGPRAQNCARA